MIECFVFSQLSHKAIVNEAGVGMALFVGGQVLVASRVDTLKTVLCDGEDQLQKIMIQFIGFLKAEEKLFFCFDQVLVATLVVGIHHLDGLDANQYAVDHNSKELRLSENTLRKYNIFQTKKTAAATSFNLQDNNLCVSLRRFLTHHV